MSSKFKRIRVASIGNGYGGIEVQEQNGRYYWGIDGYGSNDWSEIDEYRKDDNDLCSSTGNVEITKELFDLLISGNGEL